MKEKYKKNDLRGGGGGSETSSSMERLDLIGFVLRTKYRWGTGPRARSKICNHWRHKHDNLQGGTLHSMTN